MAVIDTASPKYVDQPPDTTSHNIHAESWLLTASRCVGEIANVANVANLLLTEDRRSGDDELLRRQTHQFIQSALQWTLKLLDRCRGNLTVNKDVVASRMAFSLGKLCVNYSRCQKEVPSSELTSIVNVTLPLFTGRSEDFTVGFQVRNHLCESLIRLINGQIANQIDLATNGLQTIVQSVIANLNLVLNCRETELRQMSMSVTSKGFPKIVRYSQQDPTVHVDILATVFRSLNKSLWRNRLAQLKNVNETLIVGQCWPSLSRTLEMYASTDVRVVERAVRLLRFAFRLAGNGLVSLLNPLVGQMITIFSSPSTVGQFGGGHTVKAGEHTCLLYLGSILVEEFTTEEAGSMRTVCISGLLSMLSSFIPTTFASILLPSTSPSENGGGGGGGESRQRIPRDSLRLHGDMIDDFFRLNIRFVQCCPNEYISYVIEQQHQHQPQKVLTSGDDIVSTSCLDLVFDLAVASLLINHRDARRSTLTFLVDLLRFVATDHNRHHLPSTPSTPSTVHRCLPEILDSLLVQGLILDAHKISLASCSNSLADIVAIVVSLRNLVGTDHMTSILTSIFQTFATENSRRVQNTGTLSSPIDDAQLSGLFQTILNAGEDEMIYEFTHISKILR